MSNRLTAALYLHAIFPAMAVLASRDPVFRNILSGRDTAITLQAPGLAPTRIARTGNQLTVGHTKNSGDLHLCFPSCGQLVRACTHRAALALPIGGWRHFSSGQRLLEAAGIRLEQVLTDHTAAKRDPDFGRLHVPAALTVAVAGTAVWLRHHADGPALHQRYSTRLITFTTADPAFSIWLDLQPKSPAWGLGAPPRAADAAVHFADLPTVVAELSHELDSLAALGFGTLRITGLLPLAEQLGLIMQDVDRILRPATSAH